MINCIYFPPSTEKYNRKYLADKYDFLNENHTLWLDMNKIEYYTEWKHNELHITTNCHYHYILPEISKFLGFNYNIDDFHIIQKFDKTQSFDISYLIPNQDKLFKITYQDKQYTCGYAGLIGFTNFDKCCKNFMDNTNFIDITPEYHLLFFAPHQCCIIENTNKNNGKTLIISGDSQLIPDIPILAYYYKKIVYLDKRKGDFANILFNISHKDDVVYEMSKYELDKYLNINFKKCRYVD